MTWNPRRKVIDLRSLTTNLFTYIQANQTDALNWANGGSGLADIAKFYKSAAGRLNIQFPSLMLIEKQIASDAEDLITAVLTLSFELHLAGADGDALAAQGEKYAMALESMFKEIPKSTLTSGSMNPMSAHLGEPFQIAYNSLKGKQGSSMFYQVVEIDCTFILRASAQ